MSAERWEAARWIKSNPECVFCDVLMEPMIIFHIEDNAIRGWKCPKCGFTLIYPKEIPKVMEFLKGTAKIVRQGST